MSRSPQKLTAAKLEVGSAVDAWVMPFAPRYCHRRHRIHCSTRGAPLAVRGLEGNLGMPQELGALRPKLPILRSSKTRGLPFCQGCQ
eukprot:5425723-Pyramimonas_sp.AAC.1